MAASRRKAHPIPEDALEEDIAILGQKGRGKTFTAKGIVEQLLAMHRQVLVLDPLSVWWGLKSGKDGKSPGFEIPVFGGPHADMPLNAAVGSLLGELFTTLRIPAVLDMGQMRKAEQARLVADLLDYLFTHNREPLWLVLEEADAFAPQQPMGELNRVLSEVDRIARRGRSFGFRLISITQRPAKLNKDVLTQLSTLIALGVNSPQDRDAIKAWVEGNADRVQARKVYDSLAQLAVGEGWVWAPHLKVLKRVKFPPIATLDTSKTPKAGEGRITAPVLASADIAEITQRIREIETTQGGKAKRGREETPFLFPFEPSRELPKDITATTASQLAAAIRSARIAADLSQSELAEKMKTSQANIVRLEKGRSLPSTGTLQRIAKATGHKLVITFTRL